MDLSLKFLLAKTALFHNNEHMGILLALPFYFRKADGIPPVEADAERLVIVSAHNKSVRD